jgi:hypothetical protein
MRIAFQSSPIFSLPRSAVLPLRAAFDFDPPEEPSLGTEDFADDFTSLTD